MMKEFMPFLPTDHGPLALIFWTSNQFNLTTYEGLAQASQGLDQASQELEQDSFGLAQVFRGLARASQGLARAS